MIGFNHAAVGGFIGKFLPLPIALPLALASHFVLYALPHYGVPHSRRNKHFGVYSLLSTFLWRGATWGGYSFLDTSTQYSFVAFWLLRPTSFGLRESFVPDHSILAITKAVLRNGTLASSVTNVRGAYGLNCP